MYEKENMGQKPYKAKPCNHKEGATKETKLCLPLLPPDQAFSDTVSLMIMYNVETILVIACLTPSLTPNTHSLPQHPSKKKKKKKDGCKFVHGNKPD